MDVFADGGRWRRNSSIVVVNDVCGPDLADVIVLLYEDGFAQSGHIRASK